MSTTAEPQRSEARERLFALLALILFAAALFGPLRNHVALSADPRWFNDDVRQQIWPLHRYRGDGLFPNDRIADFFLGSSPIGFRALYAVASRVTSPDSLSR